MGFNFPTFTENNVSFGPGRAYLGAAGATPTVDIGGITEDGIDIELESEVRHITQGNPKLKAYTFIQAQGVMITLRRIEWDLIRMPYGLGAGNTTSVSASDTLTFGGDPIAKRCAIQIVHQMAQPGQTLTANIWRCVAESGFNIALGQDEHTFEFKFAAQRVTTDWASASLGTTAELIQIIRQKT